MKIEISEGAAWTIIMCTMFVSCTAGGVLKRNDTPMVNLSFGDKQETTEQQGEPQ